MVLGFGGLLLGRAFSALGLNPTPSPPTASSGLSGSSPSTPPAPREISAGDRSLMGLADAGSKAAPPLSLSAGPGLPLSLAEFSGKVVVVTFFDAPCDDICPIMASEISSADAALGSSAGRVEFVTVDSDPLAVQKWPSAVRIFAGRPTPSNWTFASGTLQELNRAWTDYGITVDVYRPSGRVTHNDRMYFIDPNGRLRYLSTPYANETSSGRYTLAPGLISRWGHAIAGVADGLLR